MATNTVNLAMVGLGGWGKNVVRNFAQAKNCNLSYVCDANESAVQRHAALFPQAMPTTSFTQILADDSVDAVALATPAPMHYEMARDALLAGKHVYVEKPMTLTSAHSEHLVELADQGGLKLMVGHLLEYHPAVQMMKEQADSGALGDICYMYCQRLNLGVVRKDENAFWSLAPHDISVVLYLFGQEPEHIVASGQCFLQPEIEDVVFATLYFPDGRMANIHVSWLDPHKKRSMVLVGTEKMLVFDDMEASEKIRIFDKGARIPEEALGSMQSIGVRHGDILIPRLDGPEPLSIETQHFVDAILNDTCPRSDGRDGLRVVKILEEVEQQLHGRASRELKRAA